MFEFDAKGPRDCVHYAMFDNDDDADLDDDNDDDDYDDYEDVPGDSEGEPYGLEEVRGLEEEP